MKTLICNCNRTMPLDGPTLARALSTAPSPVATTGRPATATPAPSTGLTGLTGPSAPSPGAEPLHIHNTLCRREAPAFQRAAKSGEPLLVACTQESRLFLELAEQTEGAPALDVRPIRFVNIRETAGWSRESAQAAPKIAALIAAAQLPQPAPVASVGYRSGGRCLVIGPAEAAERAADMLGPELEVELLVPPGSGALAQRHALAVHAGELTRLQGHLGAFEAEWESRNPIDLDLCTRCNACIAACPEGAIDFGYQVDLSACRSHRDCVRVCEAAGAIDFERAPSSGRTRIDLVLDLREAPAFGQPAPPQGYVHAGRDERRWVDAVLALRGLVGEFDKPRFVQYRQALCAHSRNERIGCSACIDVCSASAVRSDASLKGKTLGKLRRNTPAQPDAGGQGGGIVVDPYLCVGCGACTTVCPSGALAYAGPGTVDQGRVIRTLLSTYQRAGGRDALLLLHSQGAGQRLIEDLGRAAAADRSVHGLPARVIPLPLWHTASVGLDLWLMAIAQGASQVAVLLTDEEAPDYRRALAEQMAVGQALLSGLGYAGEHLRLLSMRDARDLAALDAALRAAPAQGVARACTLAAQAEKRQTLEIAIDHLVAQAPLAAAQRPEAIALPAAGAPFGSLQVDAARCTMCLSCVGACPQAALQDNPEAPQLKFIERNCVQCGLCAGTCPESAIRLEPRWWLADEGRARRQARVLHEVAPALCIQCGKPFGTAPGVEAMVAKLSGHAAFAGDGARRLRMCNDCRVVAMFSNPNEVKISDIR